MMLAGFDIATRSGAALMEGDKIVHVEAFRPKGDGDAEIFHGFRAWYRALLVSHEVQHVAIEQPLPTDIEVQDKRQNAAPGAKRNPITMKTYLRLYGLRGHALEICDALNIPCREVHQGTWRKAFLGSGRADKDAAVAQCKLLGLDLKSKDAAESVGIVWWLNGEISKPVVPDLFQGAA